MLRIALVTMFFALGDGTSHTVLTTPEFCEKVAEARDDPRWDNKKFNILVPDRGLYMEDVVIVMCLEPDSPE